MIRRILTGALVVIFVQTSLPVSVSAQQPAPAKAEQTSSATSVQPRVYADLPQAKRTLDLQNATRVLALTGATPLQPASRQTTSDGGSSKTREKIIMWSIIAGAGIGILALENIAPKGSDARCSSANPQFCN